MQCSPRHRAPAGSVARRSGQAMIELVAAIICILVVVTGLLQLILLGTADTNTMVEATARAAERASSSLVLAESPDNIADWDVGQDEMQQTKDDEPVSGSLMPVQVNIAGATAPNGDWGAVDGARHNDIAMLNHGAIPSTTLGMVRGEASEDVEVIPAAKAFFGLRDPMEIRNKVWMTATGALY